MSKVDPPANPLSQDEPMIRAMIGWASDPTRAINERLVYALQAIAALRDASVEVFDEWRVTGEPGATGVGDHRFPQYEFVWSKYQGPNPGNPETAARTFMARTMMAGTHQWEDGPHLHRRTVTRTAWTEAPTPKTVLAVDDAGTVFVPNGPA